jgi:hypothetical protein
VLALLNYIERTTGRRDLEDITGLVQPDDPVLQELWHAKSTSDEACRLARDDAFLCSVVSNCPRLVAIAEDLRWAFAGVVLCRSVNGEQQ